MTDQHRSLLRDSIDGFAHSPASLDVPDITDAQGQRQGSRSRTHDTQRQDPGSSARQFLFIDASADRNTSSEAVRVHVMREAHRSRRERQGVQGRSRTRPLAAQDEMVILDFRNQSRSRPTSLTPPTPSIQQQDSSEEALVSPLIFDWLSIVRAGVSQSALDSTQELSRLAEGYLGTMRLVQPDVLSLCKGDSLSLSAYLALAALQLASNHQEPSNVASVQFEARALELLRSRITQSPGLHTDTTIVAVLLLVQLERKDNAESALFHRNALQSLIRDRGGLERLEAQNAELYKILLESKFVKIAA